MEFLNARSRLVVRIVWEYRYCPRYELIFILPETFSKLIDIRFISPPPTAFYEKSLCFRHSFSAVSTKLFAIAECSFIYCKIRFVLLFFCPIILHRWHPLFLHFLLSVEDTKIWMIWFDDTFTRCAILMGIIGNNDIMSFKKMYCI